MFFCFFFVLFFVVVFFVVVVFILIIISPVSDLIVSLCLMHLSVDIITLLVKREQGIYSQ